MTAAEPTFPSTDRSDGPQATVDAVADNRRTVEAPAHTGSKVTFRLGLAALIATALLLLFGLVISGPDVSQRDAARLLYIHLPSIAVTYLAFLFTAVGSAIYLRKGSVYWDLLAGAAAEIGVLFSTFVLVTGALWGKPIWGTYWQWEPRLTSFTVMFVMYLGYLAVRRLELPPAVRSRRAAVLGIVSFANVFIVHYSVKWWRGLHQGKTFDVDTKIDGTMLFSAFLGMVAFLLIGSWLLIHRFRVAWLSRELERVGLAQALAERRAEIDATGLLGRSR